MMDEEGIVKNSQIIQGFSNQKNGSVDTSVVDEITSFPASIQINGIDVDNHDIINNKNNSSRPTNLQDVNGKRISNPYVITGTTTAAVPIMKHEQSTSPGASNNKKINFGNNGFLMNHLRNSGNRRQSLPVDTNLDQSASMLSSSLTQGFDLLGSPLRRSGLYTPLMTPAISISSLVSSLEGSMDNLHLTDDAIDGGEPSVLNNPEQFDILLEQDDDIIDSRLRRYFETLEKAHYFEQHQGKDFQEQQQLYSHEEPSHRLQGSASLNNLSDIIHS